MTSGDQVAGNGRAAVVIGPYRVHNFGDDLVGAIIARRLQQVGYSVTVPKLGAENSRWLGIQHAEDYGDLIAKSDLVVVGGGGIMSDTSGAKPGASYLDIVARASMRGDLDNKRVLVTSVGAGPWILERSKLLAFGVSMIAERVGVREQESLDHLASIGVGGNKVVLGADCALLAADYLEFKPKKTRPLAYQFDVGSFDDVQSNPRLAGISEAAKLYVQQNASKIALVSNGRGRPQLAQDVRGTGIQRYAELGDYLSRLAGYRAMFTSHLHLAITSYSLRIPTFSLYVREKTRRFYEQIGHPERAVDLKVATVDDFKRLSEAAETSEWTQSDEDTLQRLKGEARKLLEIID